MSDAQWELEARSHVALRRVEVEVSHGLLTVEFLELKVGELELAAGDDDADADWSGLTLYSGGWLLSK